MNQAFMMNLHEETNAEIAARMREAGFPELVINDAMKWVDVMRTQYGVPEPDRTPPEPESEPLGAEVGEYDGPISQEQPFAPPYGQRTLSGNMHFDPEAGRQFLDFMRGIATDEESDDDDDDDDFMDWCRPDEYVQCVADIPGRQWNELKTVVDRMGISFQDALNIAIETFIETQEIINDHMG